MSEHGGQYAIYYLLDNMIIKYQLMGTLFSDKAGLVMTK